MLPDGSLNIDPVVAHSDAGATVQITRVSGNPVGDARNLAHPIRQCIMSERVIVEPDPGVERVPGG